MMQDALAAVSPHEQDYFAWYAQRFGLDPARVRDLFEVARGQVVETHYPRSLGVPRCLELSVPGQYVEHIYSALVRALQDLGYARVIVVIDSTTPALQSAAYDAAMGQRGVTEDRVAQHLSFLQQAAAVLFRLVQELRETDKRLQQHVESEENNAAGEEMDVTLKSQWLNVVEGGEINPASIFGQAQQMAESALPELFYALRRLPLGTGPGVTARDIEVCNAELSQRVKALSISPRAGKMLAQHLARYYTWKDKTLQETREMRRELLQNLKTQYSNSREQLAYLMPHLRALRWQALAIDQSGSPELPSTFEVTLREIELLARRQVSQAGPHAVVLVSLQFLIYVPRGMGTQHGVPRVGRVVAQYRSYCWTDDDIKRYVAYRQGESLDLLDAVSDDLRQQLSAFEAAAADYLHEIGASPLLPVSGAASPSGITGMAKGIPERLARAAGWARVLLQRLVSRSTREEARVAEELAGLAARKDAFACYNSFKKAHGLLTW